MISDLRSAVKENRLAFVKFLVLPVFLLLVLVFAYYIAYGPWRSRFVFDPFGSLKPEQRDIENRRIASLDSWLCNLCIGNWGGTPASVRLEAARRSQVTLFLTGIAAVAWLSSAVVVSRFSVLWRTRNAKTSSVAHSVHGFFFGLTLLTALTVAFILAYFRTYYGIVPAWSAPSQVFGLGAQQASPVPDLFGPAVALLVACLVKAVMTVRSGGLPSPAESWRQRFASLVILPDFGFILMSVFLLEPVFGIEGLGKWFMNGSAQAAPYYAVPVAVCVATLLMMVGFGYVSTVFAVIRSGRGTVRDARREEPSRSLPDAGVSVVRKLMRRRTFLAGLSAVALLVLLAAGAPLFAPYDPEATGLADEMAMPEWGAVFNPAYRSSPRSMVVQLNWTLDTESVPEHLRSSLNVTADGEWTLLRVENLSLNDTQPICIPLRTLNFSYPYDAPGPGHFNIAFELDADPRHCYNTTGLQGESYTVCPSRSRYNVELNLTGPHKTFSLWDAE